MSLHDDLQKKLSAEQMQQLDDILGDDFDWDLVPRDRLNKVIAQRNELRKQVNNPASTSQQQQPTKKKPAQSQSKANDDDDSGVTYSQEELDNLLQQTKDQMAAELNTYKVKQATLSKLQTEKALDPELVFGLLDASKLSLNDKGELQGLDDAGFKAIKDGKKFLFGTTDNSSNNNNNNVPTGTGKNGGGASGNGGDALDAALADVFSGYTFIETDK